MAQLPSLQKISNLLIKKPFVIITFSFFSTKRSELNSALQHYLQVIFCKTFHQTISSQGDCVHSNYGRSWTRRILLFNMSGGIQATRLGRGICRRSTWAKLALLLWLLLSVYFWGTPDVMACTPTCSVAPTVTLKTCINLEQTIYGERNTIFHEITGNFWSLKIYACKNNRLLNRCNCTLCATQVKKTCRWWCSSPTFPGKCKSVNYVLVPIVALNFNRYADNMEVHYAANAISP